MAYSEIKFSTTIYGYIFESYKSHTNKNAYKVTKGMMDSC